jgi:hypothetical protein
LELMATVAIVGMIAGLAVMRFGHSGVSVVDGQGVARRLTLGLQAVRRQAISEGVPAALVINRSGGNVTGWSLVRAAAGGDQPVDDAATVPAGVTVTPPADRWQFDYTGALTVPAGGGTIVTTTDDWTWSIRVFSLTGYARCTEAYTP